VPVGTRFFVRRVDPYLFNEVRYTAAALSIMPLFLKARPWRWPAHDLALMGACALLAIPGYNIPVALGARSVSAGQLGLLIATEPVLIIGFALLIERRRIDARLTLGSAIALAGVSLTSGVLGGATVHVRGALEVLTGAASWSLYTVLVARLYRRQGALAATGAIVVVGSVLLILTSLPLMAPLVWPDAGSLLALIAMGVLGSTLGFILWNFAGAHVPAERLGLFLYLIPLGSVISGALLLGEALTVTLVAGGLLTLAGVWIATHVVPGVAAAAEP